MLNRYKKLTAAVLTAATLITATAVPAMPIQCVNTQESAIDLSDTMLYVSRDHIATKTEATAANRTWQGEYIDPADITSYRDVIMQVTGHSRHSMGDDALDNNNPSRIPVSEIGDAARKTACICISDYNETGCDLYYEADLKTGIWYQTLNTASCTADSTIRTRTEELANDPGDKMIISGKERSTINGFDWMTGNKNITVSYEDIAERETELISSVVMRDESSANKGTFEYTNAYELFGPTWICTYTHCDADGKFAALKSDKNIAKTVSENVWIKTNGHKGDRLEITSLCDMVNRTPLLENRNDELAAMKSSYVLKEDNEALPVGYGNYLIYNKSTGIYETVASWVPEFICGDYRMENQFEIAMEKRNATNGADYTFDALAVTGLYKLTAYDLNESNCIAYDVPRTLNLTDTEYTTLMCICDEYPGGRTQNAYLFDSRADKELNAKVSNAVTSFVKNTDEHSILPYVDMTIYDVPTNTTPMLAFYASNTLYESTNIQSYMYPVAEDQASRTNDYFKEIGAKSVKRTVASKSGESSSLPSYNGVIGDANQDGIMNIADIVTVQKYMLGEPDNTNKLTMASYAACNLCKDDTFDVFDLVAMKQLLVNKHENLR